MHILRNRTTIARGLTRPDGTFRIPVRLARPGPFRAATAVALSPPLTIRIHPLLETRLLRQGEFRLALLSRLRPRFAGTVRVEITRGARPALARTFPGKARVYPLPVSFEPGTVTVTVLPRPGYAPVRRRIDVPARRPRLALGSRSPAVPELLRRLAGLGYAAPEPRPAFDEEVLQAVYAFQKAQDLPRSGVVDQLFWSRLERPRPLRPRVLGPGRHIEIDIRRQILLLVREGRVALVAPVSTAGIPGYRTPRGRFAIYRKVPGYDPSPLGILYKPMYFLGGYAIHGNPSVPPYPASHGCVRVPNFVIERLFASEPYGEAVYIYESAPPG